MQSLDQQYEPSECRLFIDANKTSLKAVLLHNGNKKPSVPIADSTKTKETYEKMKQLLACIRYDTHQWRVFGDLKVIGLLLGLQIDILSTCISYICGTVGQMRHITVLLNGQLVPI